MPNSITPTLERLTSKQYRNRTMARQGEIR